MVHKNSIEKMDRIVHKNLRRRNEDIEYWRQRAGWFDDDVSMKEFNSGVYDTYYNTDDDGAAHRTSSTSTIGGAQGLNTFLKIGAALVAVGFAVLLYRALSRRTPASTRKVGSSKNAPSDTKQRPRSRSRSSRSRSRSRRTPSSAPSSGAPSSAGNSNYELMDEKSEARSRKSSRSRSRSRKNSKSRQPRSRSKPRQNKEVLV
jgi:hypothetical protein